MIVKYNDTFYRMIEAFIELQLPERLLIADAEKEFDSELLEEYKSLRREDLDYFKANMILLDANYFTDHAFLYFFPMVLKQIFDNEGLLKPLITRLQRVDSNDFSDSKKQILSEMIDTLKEIDETTDSQNSDEIITLT